MEWGTRISLSKYTSGVREFFTFQTVLRFLPLLVVLPPLSRAAIKVIIYRRGTVQKHAPKALQNQRKTGFGNNKRDIGLVANGNAHHTALQSGNVSKFHVFAHTPTPCNVVDLMKCNFLAHTTRPCNVVSGQTFTIFRTHRTQKI